MGGEETPVDNTVTMQHNEESLLELWGCGAPRERTDPEDLGFRRGQEGLWRMEGHVKSALQEEENRSRGGGGREGGHLK